MVFQPKVTRAEEHQELRWLGRFVLPGLFDGEHAFTIQSLGPTRVRFIQREKFKGLLVPLFATTLDDQTKRGFQAMNEALKRRAEGCDIAAAS